MKDIILFLAGGFAGMASVVIIQLVHELMAFAIEDKAKQEVERLIDPRDNEEVSILAGGDEYYD